MPPQFQNMDELKQYLAVLEARITALENKTSGSQIIKDASKTELTKLAISGIVTLFFLAVIVIIFAIMMNGI